MNSSVRRPAEVTKALGAKPFATLPYVKTPSQIFRRRLGIAGGIVTVSVLLPLTLFYVHTEVAPMTELVENLRDVLGV